MSVKMSNKSNTNNGVNQAGASSEGLFPGRCPIGEQKGPGCHQTTANRRTRRRKWSQEENRAVMQCYYTKWVWEKWTEEETACHME